jgi:excisionase family DNA binding protein
MSPQHNATEASRYLTYHGAVSYTGLSLRTIAKLVADGSLHPIRVGRRVLLDTHDIDAYLSQLKDK